MKMGLTKSEFIFVIITFYAIIVVFFGLFGDLLGDTAIDDKSITSNDKLNFFDKVILGFTNAPFWLNAIIITPLATTLLFMIVTTVLGAIFDGGS